MLTPEELIGKKIVSWGRTFTEAEFTELTNLCWAVAPQHTDLEMMKKTPFGERILGGPLVVAVALGLAATAGVRNAMLDCTWRPIAMLGLENVRFLGGFKPGDTIHVESEFTEWRPTSKPNRAVVVLHQVTYNQTGAKVMENDQLGLFENPEAG